MIDPVWYPVVAGTAAQIVVAAFVYGQLSEKTKNNASDIEELKEDGDVQWRKINSHGERISTIEGKTAARTNGAATGR